MKEFMKRRSQAAGAGLSIARAVGRDAEFLRINELPRRTEIFDLTVEMTNWLKSPGGTQSLQFVQAWTLQEFYDFEGVWGWQEVGAGKTLSMLLAPTVLQRKWNDTGVKKKVRPLYIVPANLRNEKTLKIDVPFYRPHWDMFDWTEDNVLSYEALGREQAEKILEQKMPNLLLLDESHKVKNKSAAVTRRVLRFIQRYPDTVVMALSASALKDDIREIGHVLAITHGDHSPLPLSESSLDDWAGCLSHNIEPSARVAPGALLEWCAEGESAEEGFRRRLSETPGVVIMRESDFDCALNIMERKLRKPPPLKIGQCIQKMRESWMTPSGDVIISGLEMSRHVKELAAGFFYRWLWPNNTPDLEWLEARKEWRKACRQAIKASGTRRVSYLTLDSEQPVETAVKAGQIPFAEEAYKAWTEIRGRCDPKKQAVWVSEFLVDEIEAWMAESSEPGIVWTSHVAVLQKLRKRGHPVYGGGQNDIVLEKNTCVASIDAHKEGKNLQVFGRSLWATVPQSGLTWEQGLGRYHRQGQTRDEVTAEVFLHTLELWLAFEHARSESRTVEKIIGTKPRLQRATIVVPDADEIAHRIRQQPQDLLWVDDG